MAGPKGFQTLAEFYPNYLSEHSDPRCRALHYVGSTLVVALLVFAVMTGRYATLWLLPVIAGYWLRLRLVRAFLSRAKQASDISISCLQLSLRLDHAERFSVGSIPRWISRIREPGQLTPVILPSVQNWTAKEASRPAH